MPLRQCNKCGFRFQTRIRNKPAECPDCNHLTIKENIFQYNRVKRAINELPDDRPKEEILKEEIDNLEYEQMKKEKIKPKTVKVRKFDETRTPDEPEGESTDGEQEPRKKSNGFGFW